MKTYEDGESLGKTLIKEEIFCAYHDNQPTWKDIKHIEFQDDDLIRVSYEYDEESYSDGYYISVERWVEETDEQHQSRLKEIEERKQRSKQNRYNSYLKYKEEFEGKTSLED